RGVAQLCSALAWVGGGRRIKSGRPDQRKGLSERGFRWAFPGRLAPAARVLAAAARLFQQRGTNTVHRLGHSLVGMGVEVAVLLEREGYVFVAKTSLHF